MQEIQGIDVSHYQLDINWQRVANAGKKFAIMKVMYEGRSHAMDETFNYNYEKAGVNDISRGAYIFIASRSMEDPEGDIDCFLKHLNGRKLEYGIWLDLEADVVRKRGKAYINNLANHYAERFKKAGYYCGIYCNRDWYLNTISEELKAKYDFWIARYPKNDHGEYNPNSSLKPSSKMAVAWQYSSKGRVPGIKTDVDLDVDYDGVINLAAPGRKSNYEIALEVMEGLWGTMKDKPTRKQRLIEAGYDYETIRKIVNSFY